MKALNFNGHLRHQIFFQAKIGTDNSLLDDHEKYHQVPLLPFTAAPSNHTFMTGQTSILSVYPPSQPRVLCPSAAVSLDVHWALVSQAESTLIDTCIRRMYVTERRWVKTPGNIQIQLFQLPKCSSYSTISSTIRPYALF